eukprot:jgi/Bigna1/131465/aug1.14_g6173
MARTHPAATRESRLAETDYGTSSQGSTSRHIFIIVLAFICGYFQMPFLMVSVGFFWIFYHRQSNKAQREIEMDRLAEQLWRDPVGLEKFLLGTFPGVPNWVRFPFTSRAEFLNETFKTAWPHINKGGVPNATNLKFGDVLALEKDRLFFDRGRAWPSLTKKGKNDTEFGLQKPDLQCLMNCRWCCRNRHTCPSWSLPRSILDQFLPHVDGINVYRHRGNSVVLDLHSMFVADESQRISVSLRSGPVSAVALLQNLRMRFTLRLTFKRLISMLPCFQQITLAFAEKPEVKFNLSGAHVNLTSIPGVKSWLENFVETMISKKIVWPNEINLWRPNLKKISTKARISLTPEKMRQAGVDPELIAAVFEEEGKEEEENGEQDSKSNGKYKLQGNNETNSTKTRVREGALEEPQGLLEVTLIEAQDLLSSSKPPSLPPLSSSKSGNSLENATADPSAGSSSSSSSSTSKKRHMPSPFAILTLGAVSKESSKQKHTLNPSWKDERFELVVYSLQLQKLHVAIKDSRKRGGLGELGEGFVDLRDLHCNPEQKIKLDLVGGGQLQLIGRFLSHIA